MLVDDELANSTLKRLINETGIPSRMFKYELQDDFQLLFISVAIDDLAQSNLEAQIPHIAAILKELMPVRENDYSWVVGFLRGGEVVESCFGGNLAIPDWDGEQFVE
ncbi:hypothetical protein [Duganella levis]|uniref:Uncharacterized protein n=1 Tax=Duganella levis TaxID=2692169 RepID=A0ABW9VZD2_9BURK|nr:hypothetical protein [Duganella levis]MYN27037.1 hypothetical protein [Duganella levis]